MHDPSVLDLSHHNPTPDWARLVNTGIVGIIHKATEGGSYVDDQLFKRARPAMDAGLLWATYHFLRPGNTYAQMDHYLATVDPKQGERMVIDHEDAGVSLQQLEEAVDNLLSLRPDINVSIYSGHLIKEQLTGKKSDYLAAHTSLWIAQYTTAAAPSWPTATWPQWSLWQFTDKASVNGCTKPVDGNRWNGDEKSLRQWFVPSGESPVEKPDPTKVEIDIWGPPGVEISISFNGKVVS
jgi:lysozyme